MRYEKPALISLVSGSASPACMSGSGASSETPRCASGSWYSDANDCGNGGVPFYYCYDGSNPWEACFAGMTLGSSSRCDYGNGPS